MNEMVDRDLMVALPQEHDILAVFTRPNGIQPFLDMVRAKIDAFDGDASTDAGRKKIKSFAHKITKSKTAFEEVGKQLAAEQKEIPKKIDAARKAWRETLDAWHDEVRQPVTEFEEKEKQRVEYYQSLLKHIADCGIGFIGGYPQPAGLLLHELEEKIVIDSSWGEFEAEARIAKDAALKSVRGAIEAERKRAAEAEELEKLRAEKAERDRKDNEERLRKEGEQRAREEAEADARAEKERADRKLADEKAASEKREKELIAEKEAAEQRAVEAAAKAKREIEDQKRAEEAEAARREADKAHKAKINRAALAAFVESGIEEATAKAVIKLIAAKSIPAIAIHY